MVETMIVGNTALAPEHDREELLSKAFDILLKLSPEQILEIMEKIK